jgi:hypothetical protein
MQTRHFVYTVVVFDDEDNIWSMGSVDEENKDDAIASVWSDVLRFDYEDDDFNGVVMLYDTVKRERVYYFHG